MQHVDDASFSKILPVPLHDEIRQIIKDMEQNPLTFKNLITTETQPRLFFPGRTLSVLPAMIKCFLRTTLRGARHGKKTKFSSKKG